MSVIIFILFLIAQNQLFGWSNAIKIAEQAGSEHKKPVVCFSPAGKIYVVYEAGKKIHLSSYNGTNVVYEKRISESNLLAYESAMRISKNGFIHIAWTEASSYESTVQYIKYCFYNGSSWSAITTLQALDIPGGLRPPFVMRKVEDLRMAVDANNNVFIAFMVQPAAYCKLISKYGSSIRLENWPMSGRSKHPDVAVDASFVHVAWQQLWGSEYTVAYCRRVNSANGNWQTVIDARDGIHRPRIGVDPDRVPHLFYMEDFEDTSRNTIYKYWTGNGFSQKYIVSDDYPALYNNLSMSVFDKNNIFTADMIANLFYNWKQNGVWSGHRMVGNVESRPDYPDSALSPDGKKAVVAYSSSDDSIYINISSEGPGPPPPPPPPPPPTNLPPTALFTFNPLNGLYPLNVVFDASNSFDSDGQIVSYDWNFGDNSSGSGVLTQHIYNNKKIYKITLTVTDDDGATGTATGEIEVFGLYPPLNLQYKRYENRNLFSIEYLYRISWNANPHNLAVGAVIVAYKIYRREKGFASFSMFYLMPVANQGPFEYLDRTLGSVPHIYDYRVTAVDSAGRESDWE